MVQNFKASRGVYIYTYILARAKKSDLSPLI